MPPSHDRSDPSSKSPAKDRQRRERLAAELRANIGKRKQQARARARQDDVAHHDDPDRDDPGPDVESRRGTSR